MFKLRIKFLICSRHVRFKRKHRSASMSVCPYFLYYFHLCQAVLPPATSLVASVHARPSDDMAEKMCSSFPFISRRRSPLYLDAGGKNHVVSKRWISSKQVKLLTDSDTLLIVEILPTGETYVEGFSNMHDRVIICLHREKVSSSGLWDTSKVCLEASTFLLS